MFGAVVLGVIGLAFVISAPFDDAARTGLGSALLTGLIVSIAVAAIERGIEARRVASERRRDEEQHQAMHEVARNRLGRLIASHAWAYWQLFLPYRDNPNFVMKLPTGFGDEDMHEVHRSLHWIREMMGANQRWWQDPTLRETVDALSFIATDLLERTRLPEILMEDEQDEDPEARLSAQQSLQSISVERERTVDRLAGVAQRLAEAGDSQRAFLIDGQVDLLLSPDLPVGIYAPTLEPLETIEGITLFGRRPLSPLRDEVAWIVDQLRPDPITVNEYGAPIASGAPEPAKYRWSHLFDAHDEPEGMWEQRFTQNSWLRRIFARAASELPALYGLNSPAL
ncbi:hypothetical protein AB0I82_23005 [Streptomyces sp. NPDC050315]|uniref:hypothetical protein n=1 Tax=Streptomyces sp. NPDC050315 TaxID=3155039 RepID=UPI003436328F